MGLELTKHVSKLILE